MVDELNADIDLLNASIISLGEDRVLPSEVLLLAEADHST